LFRENAIRKSFLFPRSIVLDGRGGSLLRRHLNAAALTISLARVDLLARLGNGLEHRLVRQRGVRHNRRRLALKGDLVALDA
jgi:hypothetical protein